MVTTLDSGPKTEEFWFPAGLLRCKMDDSADHEEQAASLRRSRAGKKGYIIKLIHLMKRLVSEGGSRRQLNLLMPKLLEALENTRKINDQVLQLSGNDTDVT